MECYRFHLFSGFRRNEEFALFSPKISKNGMESSFRIIPLFILWRVILCSNLIAKNKRILFNLASVWRFFCSWIFFCWICVMFIFFSCDFKFILIFKLTILYFVQWNPYKIYWYDLGRIDASCKTYCLRYSQFYETRRWKWFFGYVNQTSNWKRIFPFLP